MAREYFRVPADGSTLKIYQQDAAHFIENLEAKSTYDLIINDACHKLPSPLLTPEMSQKIAALLNPQGLFIQNLFTSEPNKGDIIVPMMRLFPCMYTVYKKKSFNLLLVGLKDVLPHQPKKKTRDQGGEVWENHPLDHESMVAKGVYRYENDQSPVEVITHIPNITYLSVNGK